MNKNIERINKIKLFNNIENGALQQLLKNAKINNHAKEKNLFIKDDKINFFHIIIEGAVKLSTVNFEGEEAVVKITQKQDYIFDVFTDIALCDAIAIEKCETLSIPIEEIRKVIRENNILAYNFLLSETMQNKKLINQIIQLKLASAKEKLGQFLLENSFQNGDRLNNIDLKYEKSLIASYLGIKPETLSRTLQKLKEEGEISTQKNKIIINKKESLCKYCNSDLAAKCNNRDEDFCEQ